MIHYSKLVQLMERREDGRPKPFSLSFVPISTGEIIKAENVVCTSYFRKGNRVNIMFLTSGEVRKIYLISVMKFNGQTVFY